MGFKNKPPLYVLPHGIEVIGEYPARGKNRYWRVRIRPHRFFPGVRVVCDGIVIHRSRAILASELGRALTPNDHAHHENEDKTHDVPANLELLTAAEHNRHHKIGTKHKPESKARISASLKIAFLEGRHKPLPTMTFLGKQHSLDSKLKMSETRKTLIASGRIARPIPPSNKGKRLSDITKQRMSAAKRSYWKQKNAAG